MSDRPIDFSSLDPARRREVWENRISNIVQAAVAAKRESESLLAYVIRYARPAMAVAAAIALTSWIGATQTRSSANSLTANAAAINLLEWASNEHVPSTSEVLASFGRTP